MEKKFIGIVKDDMKTLDTQYTGKFATYKEAHEAAEKLCKRTYGDRGSIDVIDITLNFAPAGTWWNGGQEQIEKDGKTYALYGWNGESYTDSWQVIDRTEFAGKYDICPVYQQTGEDEFEIVDYEIRER